LHLSIDERSIEVGDEVRGACELLGLDPLHVANEGRFVAFIPPHEIRPALSILQSYRVCAGAGVIGNVSEQPSGLVTIRSMIGASRRRKATSLPRMPKRASP